MREKVKHRRRFEKDIARVSRMFNEIMESVSPIEMVGNGRLVAQANHVANQLRLCRDLAGSLDDWVKDR